jgi:hypothetical protein
MSQFRPLLTQALLFEAAGAEGKIDSGLKSKHHFKI